MPAFRRFLHILLLGCLALACLVRPALARTVEDMLGRKVEIPDHIERVFGAAPPTTVLLYTLAPDTLIGLNMPFGAGSEGLVPPRVLKLPVLGSTMGHGRETNMEELLKLKPDLAVAWSGTMLGADNTRIAAQYAKIGVPVVFVRLDTLDDWPAAYELIGKLLGREARAAELAAYVRDARARVAQALAGLSEADKPVVYYAEGPGGLATECDNSFHIEAVVLAGGRNAYACRQSNVVGLEAVSLEQILAWQPRYIVSQVPGLAHKLHADPRWQDVPAVREGRILSVPVAPINWLDRPPSVTRALGMQWLAHAFHPGRYPLDLKAETRAFYKLFLGVDLDDAALARILAAAPLPDAMPGAMPAATAPMNHAR